MCSDEMKSSAAPRVECDGSREEQGGISFRGNAENCFGREKLNLERTRRLMKGEIDGVIATSRRAGADDDDDWMRGLVIRRSEEEFSQDFLNAGLFGTSYDTDCPYKRRRA